MTALTRDQIRTVPCPKCHARPGEGCRFPGAGGFKKQREGQNHFERMQSAQQQLIDRSKGPEKRRRERQAGIQLRNYYARQAETRETPTCPVCGNQAAERRTQHGIRSSCCGLWSWDRYPLVSAETHKARSEAHKAFDPIWRNPPVKTWGVTRSVAYMLLAEELGIPPEECHMKLMSLEVARQVPGAAARVMVKAQEIPF